MLIFRGKYYTVCQKVIKEIGPAHVEAGKSLRNVV